MRSGDKGFQYFRLKHPLVHPAGGDTPAHSEDLVEERPGATVNHALQFYPQAERKALRFEGGNPLFVPEPVLLIRPACLNPPRIRPESVQNPSIVRPESVLTSSGARVRKQGGRIQDG